MKVPVKVVNLTQHDVVIWADGKTTTFAPSGKTCRLRTMSRSTKSLGDIPIVYTYDWKVVGLPEKRDGVIYLVSSTVAKRVKRPDVLCPDTTEEGVIRDGSGKIIAVIRLQTFCEEMVW
jgi:hypothetical protein